MWKSLTVAAALVAFGALPAHAQTGSGSFGINASYFDPGTLAEGPQLDVFSFDETFGPGAELEFWFGDSRRWGLGLQGAYSGWNEWDTNFNNGDFGHPVTMWYYDGTLRFRLTEPTPNSRFVPYLSLGVGGVTVNPDDEESLDGAREFDFDEADVRLDTDTHTELAWIGGIGFDIFLSRSLSLRLQAKDYYTPGSPYNTIGGASHDGGHNMLFAAGLNFFWGAQGVEEPGFIREEPEPKPQPKPMPEPKPATETVTMCVVDADGDIGTVTATRYIDTDRVVVERGGREVAFTTAYPSNAPVYVKGATWYMNDEPIMVRLTDEDRDNRVDIDLDEDAEVTRLEFVRFGTTRTFAAGSNLVFVGEIDGTPVYATRTELGMLTSRIRTALTRDDDLEVILRADPALARDFANVETLYLAVEPGDPCVFQPVSLTTYVRATRG